MLTQRVSPRLPRVYAVFLAVGGLFFSITSFFWDLDAARLLRPADGRFLNWMIATGWHTLSISAAAAGWYLWRNHLPADEGGLRGRVLVLFSGLLMLGSIGASFATIAHDVVESNKTSLTQSREYTDLKNDRADLGEQIKIDRTSQRSYNAQHDPQSALIVSKHVDTLLDRQNAVDAKIKSLESKAGIDASSSPVETALAIITGDSTLPPRSIAYFLLQLFVAIVVDIAGLSALSISIEGLLLSRNRFDANPSRIASDARGPGATVHRIDSEARQKRRERGQYEGRADTGIENGINARCLAAEEAMRRGELHPSYRAVGEFTNAGAEVVRRYFDAWVQKGVLRRNGRSYQVAA